MRLLYKSRTRHFDIEDRVVATFCGPDELLERSDHVMVHSNYTLTQGLIGRGALVRASCINLVRPERGTRAWGHRQFRLGEPL